MNADLVDKILKMISVFGFSILSYIRIEMSGKFNFYIFSQFFISLFFFIGAQWTCDRNFI